MIQHPMGFFEQRVEQWAAPACDYRPELTTNSVRQMEFLERLFFSPEGLEERRLFAGKEVSPLLEVEEPLALPLVFSPSLSVWQLAWSSLLQQV